MDKAQREQRAEQVRTERERRGLSQKALAELAGVAPNTIGAIEAAKSVQVGNMGKVMNALEIEPISESLARQEMPQDVHLVTEVVSMWMQGIPKDQRAAEVLELFRFLAQPKNSRNR